MVIFTACSFNKLPEIKDEQVKKDLAGKEISVCRERGTTMNWIINEDEIVELETIGTSVNEENKTAEKIIKLNTRKKDDKYIEDNGESIEFEISTELKLNYIYYDTGWRLDLVKWDNEIKAKENKTGEYVETSEFKLTSDELLKTIESRRYTIASKDHVKDISLSEGDINSLEILNIRDNIEEASKIVDIKIDYDVKNFWFSYQEKYKKGIENATLTYKYNFASKKWEEPSIPQIIVNEDAVWGE